MLDGPSPAAVAETRHANAAQNRREGRWIFGWGLASALAGGILSAALHDRREWLGFGLTTAAFGVIDAALAVPLLDLGHQRRHGIDEGRFGELRGAKRVLEASITQQRTSGQVFALNVGLDIAYIVAGVLMFFLGRADDPNEGYLTGSGVAMISQGAFLLGFDIAGWVHTGYRAAALEALRRD